jgi:fibronectin type 3 domain-containing protein
MRTTRAWCIAALLIIQLQALVFQAQAQASLSLSWNPSPEADVVQYRVYSGTASRQYSRNYSTSANSISINDLAPGVVYFFAVTAVNSAGLESSYSEEASTSGSVNGPIVTSALTPTGITISIQTLPSATVSFDSSTDLRNWQFYTNKVANSQGLASLIESRSSSRPVRFFRARTQ